MRCADLVPVPVPGPRREAGFSLITILMMVVVLMSLALAGMNSSLVQERMAGNARDRNIALQAAEAALRDAEADVEANLGINSAFVSGCTAGLCRPPSMTSASPTSTPLWQSIDWSASAGKTRAYGSSTGATALPGVASQPRYFIEQLPPLPPPAGQSANLASAVEDAPQAFRVTARGVGVRASTVVILQSTYIKQ